MRYGLFADPVDIFIVLPFNNGKSSSAVVEFPQKSFDVVEVAGEPHCKRGGERSI